MQYRFRCCLTQGLLRRTFVVDLRQDLQKDGGEAEARALSRTLDAIGTHSDSDPKVCVLLGADADDESDDRADDRGLKVARWVDIVFRAPPRNETFVMVETHHRTQSLFDTHDAISTCSRQIDCGFERASWCYIALLVLYDGAFVVTAVWVEMRAAVDFDLPSRACRLKRSLHHN